MKKYYFPALIFATLMVSCEKSLDLLPKDSLNYDNYYKSEEDAVAAINAIYDVLGNTDMYSSGLWLIQDIASDDCDLNPNLDNSSLKQFDQYTIQSTNNNLQGIWNDSYNGILRANLALEKIPGISMDSDRKKALKGEAHFLRALFYFI